MYYIFSYEKKSTYSPTPKMKVKSKILNLLHLDREYSLLSGRNSCIVQAYFNFLDIHTTGALNDVQFYVFLKRATDLDKTEIYRVFDMLDVDGSSSIEYNEFYLMVCILVSIQDHEEKKFIYHHSRTVFDLMDRDGSATIDVEEFEIFGLLFNLGLKAIRDIFNDFDVSGDQQLDYGEFKLFAMACIDRGKTLSKKEKDQEKAAKGEGKSVARHPSDYSASSQDHEGCVIT